MLTFLRFTNNKLKTQLQIFLFFHFDKLQAWFLLQLLQGSPRKNTTKKSEVLFSALRKTLKHWNF